MRRFFGVSRCRSGRAVGMPGPPARAWRRGSTVGRIAALGIVVAGVGCAGGGEEFRSPSIGQEDGTLTIEVLNHGFEELTIHALWLGRTRRLGNVGGTNTVEFVIPWAWTDELRLRIEVLAGSQCLTRPIFASPGDHIYMEVQQYLRSCGF